ncbi:unnamed protein product [Coffea canephora]|uniref:DH200=94 genomic scaffold, scaffold_3641 n=1 Tax=Coffea canephora TaxID=49390 RepID=A0A068VKZ3_COFCA|nr:unnamed protein product [Coffea canephora]
MEDVIVEALLSNEREAQILGSFLGSLRCFVSKFMKPLKRHSALLCVAFHNERNKIQIANSGAIPVLLEIIQCQKESLIDLAAAALLVLSSCSANKLAIAASGAVRILVGSLNSQLTEEPGFQNLSVQAKLDIISIFHNLSTHP